MTTSTEPDSSPLHSALAFLRDEVAPRAHAIDSDPEALREALQGLCARGLMALRRPHAYGGPAISEGEFREFQETVARYSGALAFLQTQHQSAVAMLARSDNEELKQAWLPRMADGGRLLGIGFSQLRRPGHPQCRAIPIAGGDYRLDGEVPWITGWTFYDHFLIGAERPDGVAVFGIVPFVATECDGGSIALSEPMRLAAMESPLTVSARLDGWRLSGEHVAFHRPPGWIHQNDLINITLQGFFAIGCAQGSLDVIEAAHARRPAEFLRETHEALAAEIAECRRRLVAAQHQGEDTTPERLALRAWAIDLAVRCAHAAVAASGGAANSLRHPAQRLYREALVYTVSAQTTPIMEATLRRLARTPS